MGLHKSIESPEQFWELFTEYKSVTKSSNRYVYVLAPRISEMIKQPLEVPLTKEGFYNFVANRGIICTLKDYFSNRDNRYDDFVPIVSRVLDEIRQDQIEGGMVGQYNSTITARLNGLADKTESLVQAELNGGVSDAQFNTLLNAVRATLSGTGE